MICASWSDKPLIRGCTDKLNVFLSMNILSISVCELSTFLVGNLTVPSKLKDARNDWL